MASDSASREVSRSAKTSGDSGPAVSANGAPQFSLRGLVISPKLFAVLAALLLLLLLCLQQLVVVASTYVHAAEAPSRSLDRGWAFLSALAMIWAIINVYWSGQAAKTLADESRVADNSKTAMFGHFAMAIGCGLIALGVHTVMVARAFGTAPIVMDYSHSGQTKEVAGEAPSQAIAGDANEGRKVFSTTCVTCHGPSGDGLPNLAPSLRGSPFIASADDAAIAGVIRQGRAATDPANKTKKVMPARGGNPFLGDDKIANVVAFVRAIQSEAPSAAPSDPNATPPVQLAKWVVPDASPAPAALVSLDNRNDIGDDPSLGRREQMRRSGWVQALTLAMTGIHGLFLLGVMVASSHILVRGLQEKNDDDDQTWWTWSSVGWVVASGIWLVVFLFGFVMLS